MNRRGFLAGLLAAPALPILAKLAAEEQPLVYVPKRTYFLPSRQIVSWTVGELLTPAEFALRREDLGRTIADAYAEALAKSLNEMKETLCRNILHECFGTDITPRIDVAGRLEDFTRRLT